MLYNMNRLTWVLGSNRSVGVWLFPWGWHILSIPLTTVRGRGAETSGLDDVSPPDDICSRTETYIYICIFYMSYVIGRIYAYKKSVIQYWWSCIPSHHINFRLYLYFLNIVLYFFKYSCTNVFHRRSLYAFYPMLRSIVISITVDDRSTLRIQSFYPIIYWHGLYCGGEWRYYFIKSFAELLCNLTNMN